MKPGRPAVIDGGPPLFHRLGAGLGREFLFGFA